MGFPGWFTPGSRPRVQREDMGDFLAVIGICGFVAAMLGLIWGLERV
jgi:hypothetical protein